MVTDKMTEERSKERVEKGVGKINTYVDFKVIDCFNIVFMILEGGPVYKINMSEWLSDMHAHELSCFWFGLVSLINGISTFIGYLMPKLFSLKNSCGTI